MEIDSVRLLGGSIKQVVLPVVPSGNRLNKGSIGIVGSKLIVAKADNALASDLATASTIDLSQALFEFTAFTFTSAGLVGPIGPTLAQVKASAGASKPAWMDDTRFYNCANGKQKFVVPKTGDYRIEALGGSTDIYMRGAQVSGIVTLQKGEVLTLMVGQRGSYVYTGAGATFVVSSASGVLMIGGGAGGNKGSTTVSVSTANGAANGAGGAGYGITSGGKSAAGTGGASYANSSTGSQAGATNALSFTGGGTGGTGAGTSGSFSGGFGGGGGAGQGVINHTAATMVLGGGGGAVGGDAIIMPYSKDPSTGVLRGNNGSSHYSARVKTPVIAGVESPTAWIKLTAL